MCFIVRMIPDSRYQAEIRYTYKKFQVLNKNRVEGKVRYKMLTRDEMLICVCTNIKPGLALRRLPESRIS